MSFHFDPNISAGTVLHLIGLLLALLGLAWRVAVFLQKTKTEITAELHAMHATNLAALARLDSRLAVVESRVSDLWAGDR